jgi:3-phosphoshikimate 1-carboxyvinyltransferase
MSKTHANSSSLTASKTTSLKGNVTVPGDKSISHRALILGGVALGTSKIYGLLESEDVLNTKTAMQKLGVTINKIDNYYEVEGVTVGGLSQPTDIIDCGNSGTGVRLLMGLVCSYNFKTTFTGDSSLQKRPMKRVTDPLESMGAVFNGREGGLLPIEVDGSNKLTPITYKLPMASAQVKSAIMLAALNTAGKTTVIEPEETRDHTELMLKYLGAEIEVEKTPEGNKITVTGYPKLKAKTINVPADPSSAAFLAVAALITPNSEVVINNVLINPLRFGVYQTLVEMGANIEFLNKRIEAGEEIADIKCSYSQLKGVTVPASRAPSMIDEYPILSVAAANATGTTKMLGLKELKVKESDRLKAIYDGIIACGGKAEIDGDNLYVEGTKLKGGANVTTHGDHRIAMSFLVAGLVSDEKISVDEAEMINTSFTGFADLMRKIGANIS